MSSARLPDRLLRSTGKKEHDAKNKGNNQKQEKNADANNPPPGTEFSSRRKVLFHQASMGALGSLKQPKGIGQGNNLVGKAVRQLERQQDHQNCADDPPKKTLSCHFGVSKPPIIFGKKPAGSNGRADERGDGNLPRRVKDLISVGRFDCLSLHTFRF